MATRKRRKRATTTHRRRRRRPVARANPVTRRRRRRRHAVMARRANPVRRRRHHVRRNPRRHYRRNPGLGTNAVMRTVVQGVKDGFAVTLGQGINNFVTSKIPFGQTTTIGKGAMQLLVGTLSGVLIKKVTKSERFASFYVAGAYSNVIRTALQQVPGVGGFLSGVGEYYRAPVSIGEYYRGPAAPGMSGWGGTDALPLLASGSGSGYGVGEDSESDLSAMLA